MSRRVQLFLLIVGMEISINHLVGKGGVRYVRAPVPDRPSEHMFLYFAVAAHRKNEKI